MLSSRNPSIAESQPERTQVPGVSSYRAKVDTGAPSSKIPGLANWQNPETVPGKYRQGRARATRYAGQGSASKTPAQRGRIGIPGLKNSALLSQSLPDTGRPALGGGHHPIIPGITLDIVSICA